MNHFNSVTDEMVEARARHMCACLGQDPDGDEMMSPKHVAMGYSAKTGGWGAYREAARLSLAADMAREAGK